MLNAKRDGYGEGAASAIPSMGAVEGRIAVLEVIARTSLKMALKPDDRHAVAHALSLIRTAMHEKCMDMKLSTEDMESAIRYAQELIEATLADMNLNIEDPSRQSPSIA